MRSVLFLLALSVLSLSCSGLVQCQPGSCPTGEHCVFVAAATAPQCLKECDLADAGSTCSAGDRCQCGGSCQGCKNCVPVCGR